MSVRVLLITLLFSLTVLAGCLGGDDDVDGDDPDDKPAFDEDTGSVKGRIQNFDTQTPVNNSDVSLIDLEDGTETASNRTNDDGEYLLRNVPPGNYRLHAGAPCCHGQHEIITVEANKEFEKDFSLLPYDDLPPTEPYSTQDDFVGFINCGVMASEATMVPCTHPLIADDDSQQTVRDHVDVNQGLQTITLALEWETPGLLGSNEMKITIEDATGNIVLGSEVGGSPIEWSMDLDDFEDASQGWDEQHEGETWTLSFVVVPAQVPSVVYQQKFTVYYHLHYLDSAPDGFSAVPDG